MSDLGYLVDIKLRTNQTPAGSWPANIWRLRVMSIAIYSDLMDFHMLLRLRRWWWRQFIGTTKQQHFGGQTATALATYFGPPNSKVE
jgi:hypothetical protein